MARATDVIHTTRRHEPDALRLTLHAFACLLPLLAALSVGYWWSVYGGRGEPVTYDWWLELPDSGIAVENYSDDPIFLRLILASGETFETAVAPHAQLSSELRPPPESWLRVEYSRTGAPPRPLNGVPDFRGDYFLPRALDRGYLLRVSVSRQSCPHLSVAGEVREHLGERSRPVESFGYAHCGVCIESNASATALENVSFALGDTKVQVGTLPPGAVYVWSPSRRGLRAQDVALRFTLDGREDERWFYPGGGRCGAPPPPIWKIEVPHW